MILFLSNHVFREEEDRDSYVRQEYEYAETHDKQVIVVFLEEIDAKSVPESMWSWYHHLMTRESIRPDTYSNEAEMVALIYRALRGSGPATEEFSSAAVNLRPATQSELAREPAVTVAINSAPAPASDMPSEPSENIITMHVVNCNEL